MLDAIMAAVDEYLEQAIFHIMSVKTEVLFDNSDLFIKRAPIEQEIVKLIGQEKFKKLVACLPVAGVGESRV